VEIVVNPSLPPICLHLHGDILAGSGVHSSSANTPVSSPVKQTQVPHEYKTASSRKSKKLNLMNIKRKKKNLQIYDLRKRKDPKPFLSERNKIPR
jgi:hypothetical protein